MVRSGFSRNPKSLTLCGSSRSIKIATRSPAFGLNTVFNRRERLNGGNVSGTISFVLAIIDLEVRSRTGVSQRKYLPYVTEPVTDVGGNVSACRRVGVSACRTSEARSRTYAGRVVRLENAFAVRVAGRVALPRDRGCTYIEHEQAQNRA